MMTAKQITLTETAAPSRSKGRGWARVALSGDTVFASATGRTVEITGETVDVHLGADIRRASGRVEKERRTVTLVATGDPADVVDLSISSPQPYRVRITGAIQTA